MLEEKIYGNLFSYKCRADSLFDIAECLVLYTN